jgi:glutamate dehydrogenase (NAD(P)+)
MKPARSIPADKPALIIEYTDPVEGFKGWFVRDRLCYRMCAGGMRVQQGLTCQKLIDMARNMTCKMHIARIRVDGAKSGIDYDPSAPRKPEAVARFLQFIRPYIETVYSMGPDLNIEMEELEKIAGEIGIPSVKMAIAKAQGWDLAYYLERSSILQEEINGWTVSRLRAGYGLAASVLAVLHFLKIENSDASVAIQGFGTLAKAAAIRLYEAGVKIVAMADIDKCIVSTHAKGLDIPKLLQSSGSLLEAERLHGVVVKPSAAVAAVHCDVMVPAAIENSITAPIASSLQVKAVVPGANLAVTDESLNILQKRSIIVLPDFLAGSGGSISMEGLFAPVQHPSARAVLDHIDKKMFAIVSEMLLKSVNEKISPTAAALKSCHEAECLPDTRPYGKP